MSETLRTAAVITVSDKGYRGEREDTSGPALCGMLSDAGWNVVHTAMVPDERDMIERELLDCAEKIIYTGPIDELFDYKYGPLSYRSLRFVSKKINCKFYQNSAVVNYTSKDVPYTRIIEHKHFEFNECDGTIITMEYPEKWSLGKERFYPVNNEENSLLFEKYKKLLDGKKNFYLGGRLGMYRYFDMDDTIAAAFQLIKVILKNEK